MGFKEDKEKAMRKLKEALEKGEVDEDIIDFLGKINKKDNIYTTSSCSGRFQLAEFDFSNGKLEFKRYFLQHNPEGEIKIPEKWNGYLMFYIEPPILHIVAKDLETANKILHLAREAGFKRSGIRSVKEERIVIEVMSTEFIKAPIGKDGVLCEECYKLIMEMGRHLLKRGKEKLKRFEDLIKKI